MTHLYESFKQSLHQHGLQMKEETLDNAWINRGRIAVSSYHFVDFAIMFSNDVPATYQIVFNNVAYCKNYNDLPKYLEHINKINAKNSVYYYLALDDDGRIFARHVHVVDKDIEQCVQLLLAGVSFVREVITSFTEEFGEFVNL